MFKNTSKHERKAVGKTKLTMLRARLLAVYFKIYATRLYRNAHQTARRFDYHRPTHIALAVLIFLSAATPVLQKWLETNRYDLTGSTKALLTKPNPALTAKIKLDERGETYRFNQEAIENKKANPDQQSATIGQGASEKTKVVYGFDASKDIKKGVTLTDVNSQISFKMIPLLSASDGELIDGHIVYPLKDKPAQLIYTPEGYGLKEDLVLAKEMGDDLDFSYKLELPASLEAKLLPNGSVGIYSANSALFGNISYGSDADKTKVENAREKGTKDFLQFVIPAPIIKQTGSNDEVAKAIFELNGQVLTVKASRLRNLVYPVTIDPSAFTTTGNGFSSGNNEGGIDAGNSLTRKMSGASISRWTSEYWANSSNLTRGRIAPASAAVTISGNTYLYIIGGCINSCGNGTAISDVQYARVNTDGSLEEWKSTSFMTKGRRSFKVEVADFGSRIFMYAIAGCGSTGSCLELTDLERSEVQTDGSLGTWSATSNPLATARFSYASEVRTFGSQKLLYVMGGCNVDNASYLCTTYLNDVKYLEIKSDGTLAAPSGALNCPPTLGWCDANSIGTARFAHASVTYSIDSVDYIAIIGGHDNGTCTNSVCRDYRFAVVNSDGTLGSWTTSANNLSTARWGITATAKNGYVYVFGGCTTTAACGDNVLNTVDTAQIISVGSGDVNAWTTPANNNFRYARWLPSIATSGNNIYLLGGASASTSCRGLSGGGGTSFDCNDAQYTTAGAGGLVSPGCNNGTPIWCGTMDLTEGRQGFSTFTYTATTGTTYIYVAGGETTGNACQAGASNLCNDVVYAPILANGKIGSWQKLGSTFNIARKRFGSLVYNGKIYVLGGESTGNACQGGTSNYCNDVQYATLNPSDGSIGAWASTTAFTTGRRSFGSAVFNGYVYVVGGYNGASALSDVRYAKLSPDGSITSWINSANALPAARSSFPSMAYNGYLYVVGGCTGACGASDYKDDILKTSLKDDGSNLAWTTACTSCFTARANQAASIYNGVIYVAGGHNNSSVLGDVMVSSIGADGSIDAFTSESSMDVARYGLGLITNKGKAYTVGGCGVGIGSCTSYLSQFKLATIDILGSTGSYTGLTSLPVAEFDFGTAVYNGVIYVTGGCTADTNANGVEDCLTSTAKVQRATINLDGSISAWTDSGNYNNLGLNPVSRHASVAHNGYLYMLGGMTNDATGGVYVSRVIHSKINSDGSLASAGAWPTTTALPAGAGLGHMEAAVYNNFIYVFGGCIDNHNGGTTVGQCSDFSSKVFYAPLNADGTIGSWSESGTNYMNTGMGLVNYGLAVAGKYVFVAGGTAFGVNKNTIWVASFNETGGLSGAFASAGANSDLSANRSGPVSFAHNGNLYVAGGTPAVTNSVYTAPINFSNGTVGPWTEVTSTYAFVRGGGFAYGGRAYILGGYISGNPLSTVQYATIYNGGTGNITGTTSWSTTTALTNNRSHHASIALDSFLYVIGGQTTSNACQGGTSNLCNDVLRAPINSDGTVGSWVVDSTFATARRDLAAAVYESTNGNKYIYITGGCNTTAVNCTASSGLLSDVQFARVKTDGTGGLENWTATTAFASPARYSHTTSVYKNFIYVVGGCSATDATGCTTAQTNVQKAVLNTDGTIPSWTNTTSLPAARYSHSASIYNGKIYIIGGRQTSICTASAGTSTVSCTTVYLGSIDPTNGTIPSWSITSNLSIPLYSQASVAANGYLYTVAGATVGEALVADVYYASLNQDGSIGYWSKSLPLATATNFLGATYSHGFLYATGGSAASVTVSYGGQKAPARIGRFSILHTAPAVGNSLLDFCGGTNTEGFNFAGSIPASSTLTLLYSLAGQANNWRGLTKMISGMVPATGYNLSGSGRAIFATILIDDSHSATFPEDSSQQSTITGLNFNYRHSHAQPASRLRHGAFFTSEEKEVLDTNPVRPNPNANNFCSSI